MTPEQLAAYYASGRGEPRIHVSELDEGDHTLTTGYNINSGGEVHAYVMDDEIHVVVYDGTRLLHHESGDAMEAIKLRPGKRAYPHTTNETFALLMRRIDQDLMFANIDWGQEWVRNEMAMEPFKDKTHLDLF